MEGLVLVLHGRGFAHVGRVVEQVGLNMWRLENASMVCRKYGCSWNDLATGDKGRDTMVSRRVTDECYICSPSFVYRWRGELPTEDMN